MLTMINTVFPAFGLVLLGYVAARLKYFSEGDIQGLNTFVFNFALPVMLFRTLAQTPLPDHVEWGYLLSYYLGAFFVYGVGMLTGRLAFSQPLRQQGIFGLGAAYSNVVLLGVPVVLMGLGEAATLPLFLLLAFHASLMFSAVTAIVESARGRGQSLKKLPWTTLKGLLKNPIVGGLWLGLLFNLFQLDLPGPFERLTAMLGSAALPSAVFALGASLSRYRFRGQLPQALTLVGFKTVLHPLAVWLLATFAFHVDPLWTAVAVVMAAMPVGINAYLFAQRYDACVAPVATAILLSTGLSVGTVSVLLWWLHTSLQR